MSQLRFIFSHTFSECSLAHFIVYNQGKGFFARLIDHAKFQINRLHKRSSYLDFKNSSRTGQPGESAHRFDIMVFGLKLQDIVLHSQKLHQ